MVTRCHCVFGFAATCSIVGNRSPFLRGRPFVRSVAFGRGFVQGRVQSQAHDQAHLARQLRQLKQPQNRGKLLSATITNCRSGNQRRNCMTICRPQSSTFLCARALPS